MTTRNRPSWKKSGYRSIHEPNCEMKVAALKKKAARLGIRDIFDDPKKFSNCNSELVYLRKRIELNRIDRKQWPDLYPPDPDNLPPTLYETGRKYVRDYTGFQTHRRSKKRSKRRRRLTKKRKVHTGPRGGRYTLRKGRKVYV
jgi:hypothetical protein